MTYKYADRTIFVLGSPRSGTTWIAKLLDSHPDVIYRHEPDIALRNHDIPTICELEQADHFIPSTRAWLNALAETRCLKTAGPPPFLPKSYRGVVAGAARQTLITLLKVADRVPPVAGIAQSVTIPDFSDLGGNRRLVISSVSALGRAGLLSRAARASRFILVLRHPWGQIESVLRMPGLDSEARFDSLVASLAKTAPARQRHLSADGLLSLPPILQLAWAWVIQNELALEQLAGAKHFKVVRLFDVTHHPSAMGHQLFEFCGLSWGGQTSEFAAWSTQRTGRERYYGMRRDPAKATWGWRDRLTKAQIDAITEVVSDSVPGRMFMADVEPKSADDITFAACLAH
jgi:hypothetical protein